MSLFKSLLSSVEILSTVLCWCWWVWNGFAVLWDVGI